jgi:hypothetical protein
MVCFKLSHYLNFIIHVGLIMSIKKGRVLLLASLLLLI